MICPFFGKPCKNCAIYIGRHYYLGYSTNYRRNIGRREAANKAVSHRTFGAKVKKKFKIPILKIRVLDPFDTAL
jgi:hypothetical protein